MPNIPAFLHPNQHEPIHLIPTQTGLILYIQTGPAMLAPNEVPDDQIIPYPPSLIFLEKALPITTVLKNHSPIKILGDGILYVFEDAFLTLQTINPLEIIRDIYRIHRYNFEFQNIRSVFAYSKHLQPITFLPPILDTLPETDWYAPEIHLAQQLAHHTPNHQITFTSPFWKYLNPVWSQQPSDSDTYDFLCDVALELHQTIHPEQFPIDYYALQLPTLTLSPPDPTDLN